jgi:hypothetical protein
MLHVVWLVTNIFPKEEENRVSSKSVCYLDLSFLHDFFLFNVLVWLSRKTDKIQGIITRN